MEERGVKIFSFFLLLLLLFSSTSSKDDSRQIPWTSSWLKGNHGRPPALNIKYNKLENGDLQSVVNNFNLTPHSLNYLNHVKNYINGDTFSDRSTIHATKSTAVSIKLLPVTETKVSLYSILDENSNSHNLIRFESKVHPSLTTTVPLTKYSSSYNNDVTYSTDDHGIREQDRPTVRTLDGNSVTIVLSKSIVESENGFPLSRRRRRVIGNHLNKEGRSLKELNDGIPEEKGRKDGNPNIDDIIHGIMKLLGGNVKLKAPESADTKLTTFGDNKSHFVASTRINNRGPPRLPVLPFGLLPHMGPIRPPITPPTDSSDSNRPQFVANTRPPFLVPLPPELSSRPTLGNPYVTGIPIPEDVLSNIHPASEEETEKEGSSNFVTSVSPSFLDPVEEFEANTIDRPIPEDDEDENENPPEQLDFKVPEREPSPSDSKAASETKPTVSSTQDLVSTTVEVSSTLGSSLSAESNTESSKKSTSVKSVNMITSKKTSLLQNIKSTSKIKEAPSSRKPSENLDTKPLTKSSVSPTSITSTNPLKPISSSEVVQVPTQPLTSPTVVEDSFSPILPSSSFTQPSESPATFSSFPTRLPDPIRPFRPYATTGHPGMVFEDTISASSAYEGQVITANRVVPFGAAKQQPDVFDVTVSALQGYGSPVQPPIRYQGGVVAPLITSARKSTDGSVFIDGRKTYFDLSPATKPVELSGVTPVETLGVGTVIPEAVKPAILPQAPVRPPPPAIPPPSTNKYKPNRGFPPGMGTVGTDATMQRVTTPERARPTLGPPKRIDTCIVGYDTTCNEELGEVCRTEGDVSSCFCKPGTARKKSRTKCKKSVLLHLSLKVDRIGNRRIVWGVNYANPKAKEYQLLMYEAEKALDSAFGQSRAISNLYMESSVNKFYSLGGRVIVNSTVKLLHTPQTASPTIKKSLQRHLIRMIQTNNNFVGNSILAVEGPLNPIPDVSDVNECFDESLYDCHKEAVCSNTFGSYTCDCKSGFTDRYPEDPNKSGRFCDSCSRDFCSKRGECRVENGKHTCICEDSYYGARCEIDGEVIAVAVGASVAAVVIIILTLIFLCMWSQRWKAQDRKTEILSRLPGGGFFGGLRGRGGMGRNSFAVDVHQKGAPGTYGVTMEDRIRWAQIAENLAQQNVYTPPTSSSSSTSFIKDSNVGDSSIGLKALRTLMQGGQQEKKGSLVSEVLRLVTRRDRNNPPKGDLPRLTTEEALALHHIITLHAQMNQQQPSNHQPEQIKDTAFYDQRKVHPLPADYASVGSLSTVPQHFGMHQLNPPFMQQPYSSKAHSTYSQYGPSSMPNAPSIGGVSRAPTMGARTPVPMRDLLGGGHMGPFGGGITGKKGNSDGVGALLTESSEEDPDRPYHLPRPKSRSSVLDNDDFYFDPDDMMTSQSRLPPLPSSPPPPIPYQFDQFFKSKFP